MPYFPPEVKDRFLEYFYPDQHGKETLLACSLADRELRVSALRRLVSDIHLHLNEPTPKNQALYTFLLRNPSYLPSIRRISLEFYSTTNQPPTYSMTWILLRVQNVRCYLLGGWRGTPQWFPMLAPFFKNVKGLSMLSVGGDEEDEEDEENEEMDEDQWDVDRLVITPLGTFLEMLGLLRGCLSHVGILDLC